jgi:uncharacterized protein
MIALDTNVLVHAHRKEADAHAIASACLSQLCMGSQAWGIPSACISEFMAVVTNRRIYESASTVAQTIAQINAWLAAPSAHLLHSGEQHWRILCELAVQGKLQGGQFHDARVAAICIENGASVIYTADRDFGRFKALKTFNPLID